MKHSNPVLATILYSQNLVTTLYLRDLAMIPCTAMTEKNTLYGEGGNDTLIGGRDEDKLFGGVRKINRYPLFPKIRRQFPVKRTDVRATVIPIN